ncbi:L,D-transpeptidase family protein [Olivibacter sp. CPCC 100613]|uniref:L,D-transpeptidase family protein n=1 Tax=Olivibacter sp. CPCC 100613 TaxID=3079931 RepID=UPI002FF7C3CB
MNVQKTLLFLLVLSSLWLGCNQGAKQKKKNPTDSLHTKALKEWNKTIPGNFSEQTELSFDSARLDTFFRIYKNLESYQQKVKKFYKNRTYRFAWFDEKGLIEQAGNLTDRMLNLKDEGIERELPYSKDLDSLINAYNQHKDTKITNEELEFMLTSQYFLFADIAWQGMDDANVKANDWFVPKKKISYSDYLDSLLKHPVNKSGADIEPVYRQYEQLRGFLKKYRELATQHQWHKIIADKKSYKPGDSSIVLSQIKKRLFYLGDYTGDTLTNTYDSTLFIGVKSFQSRHGLNPDGAIGNGTINELNILPTERVKQIVVNMERSRWLPVSLNTDYLAVNIPEFKLHVYHADSLLWSCNVVVGKAMHKTVIFHGDVKYVVFSPYWNVPPSIVKNEIIPGMRRDRNYIAKHNMEITGKSGGLPSVRQKPGPKNSLGLVKFLFPNSYNIYLHDSPSKSLYNEASRAFSHGCIRVSEPEKLANFLLRNDSTWNKESIHMAMHAGKEKYVTLKKTVPVFIAYFTAFIDRDGKINFRKDIYDRDDRLAKMLMEENSNK